MQTIASNGLARWSAVACLLVSVPAMGQPGNSGTVTERAELPAGIAGERVRQVIDPVNAGDPDAVRAFAEANFVGYAARTSPAEHAADFLNFRGRTGGIDFRCDREFEHEGLPDQVLAVVRRVDGGRVIGHGGGGGDMGINAEFLMDLDSGYTFACLSNTSDGAGLVQARALE